MSTPEEYLAKAEAALAQLAEAKSEADRTRLKRAHGAYLKLVGHGAAAAERAAMRAPPKIKAEKQPTPAAPRLQGWSIK